MNNELIERIENIFCDGTTDYYTVCKLLDDCKAEIERLTKALEASGAPVAWMQIDTNGNPTNLFFNSVPEDDYHTYMPLYTAPPSIDALIAEIDRLKYERENYLVSMVEVTNINGRVIVTNADKTTLAIVDNSDVFNERDKYRKALVDIIVLEDTEENEWDAVEVVIPNMCNIAREALK